MIDIPWATEFPSRLAVRDERSGSSHQVVNRAAVLSAAAVGGGVVPTRLRSRSSARCGGLDGHGVPPTVDGLIAEELAADRIPSVRTIRA